VKTGLLRIGTSGWHYPSWRGSFYPQDTKPRDFLPYYVTRFDTTELNNPFYRAPTDKAVEAWREGTPEGFLFVRGYIRSYVFGSDQEPLLSRTKPL
jgi:uncharacterized protein YecE (DUF72 family)